jgi:hypothetical protein
VLEALTCGIVNKLLHAPTVYLKRASPEGRYEMLYMWSATSLTWMYNHGTNVSPRPSWHPR